MKSNRTGIHTSFFYYYLLHQPLINLSTSQPYQLFNLSTFHPYQLVTPINLSTSQPFN